MDKRQIKTRENIFKAFNHLLKKKTYIEITVADIIKEANIGRSTFYDHFETKDSLLNKMCNDLFFHIFYNEINKEKDHDFSQNNQSLESKINHILLHIKNDYENLSGLLSSDSSEVFFSLIKINFKKIILDNFISVNDLPMDYLSTMIAGSFVELIKYWIKKHFEPNAEVLSDYFKKSSLLTIKNKSSHN